MDWKRYLAIICITLINVVFSYKYGSRYFQYPIILSLLVVCIPFVAYSLPFFKKSLRLSVLQISYIIGIIVFTLFVHIYIDINALAVDRWSVIASFLDAFSSGTYPYFAKSHLGNPPGPMPIYYLLASPFYYMGELSLFSIIGYILFVFLFKKKTSIGRPEFLIWMLFFSMIAMLWEVMVRSNVFTNTMLITISISYFVKRTKQEGLSKKVIFWAVILGLLLSTRSVFGLVYLYIYLYILKAKWVTIKQWLLICMVSLSSFGVTFLPVIIPFPGAFLEMNPFIVQSTFLVPLGITLSFFVLSILCVFFTKSIEDIYLYAGLILFISILIYSWFNIHKYGFALAYTGSKIDISYFIFCLPFLFFYLFYPEKSKALDV